MLFRSHLKILEEGGYLDKDGRRPRALVPKGSRQSHKSIPLLGTVTAGVPILAQQQIEGYVPYGGGSSGELFALAVEGDSMINAGILDGDILIVRQQSDAHPGQIVVAMIDDEATVKRFVRKDGKVWLMPENPEYAPIDGSDCVILGLVVSLQRPHV